LIGEDETWLISVRKALEKFQHHIALIILEDFFIYKPVDTDLIKQCVDHMTHHNVGYLRLNRNAPRMLPYGGMQELDQFDNGTNYRCALQIKILKKHH